MVWGICFRNQSPYTPLIHLFIYLTSSFEHLLSPRKCSKHLEHYSGQYKNPCLFEAYLQEERQIIKKSKKKSSITFKKIVNGDKVLWEKGMKV